MVFNFSAQFIGLADFGTEIGSFISNLVTGILPVLLFLGIIAGIIALFGAVVYVIRRSIENNAK
jgi:sorbitol-specific phosphotransferase system component IIC